MCVAISQGVFSIVLLGLTSARIHYTSDLPAGDPLNDGVSFYGERNVTAITEPRLKYFPDPIVVELLVTTILTMAWCIYMCAPIASPFCSSLNIPKAFV